jgi:perosamine synthetase
VHRQPAYRDYAGSSFPRAEQASRDMFSIPVHPTVSADDRERVVKALASS